MELFSKIKYMILHDKLSLWFHFNELVKPFDPFEGIFCSEQFIPILFKPFPIFIAKYWSYNRTGSC